MADGSPEVQKTPAAGAIILLFDNAG